MAKSFDVYLADVGVARSSVVAVIRLGRSRFNVRQLWDDQHRFRQICRDVAWVRLPGRPTHALQQSVVVWLLFWHSSHGLNGLPVDTQLFDKEATNIAMIWPSEEPLV